MACEDNNAICKIIVSYLELHTIKIKGTTTIYLNIKQYKNVKINWVIIDYNYC